MNTIRCEGLDGSNPLHFLASLGTFRLISLSQGNARMSWSRQFPWQPVFQGSVEEDEAAAMIAASFGWASVPLSTPTAGESDRKRRPRGRDQETDRVKRITEHFPVAAGAEVIKRPQRDFRRLAEELVRHPGSAMLQQELAAAMASDAVTDRSEEPGVTPTLFSFSNKQSGKFLLKDFANCALLVSPQTVLNTLTGRVSNRDNVTTLRWDPIEQRSYAMQWGDPGVKNNRVAADGTLNALAFVGLAAFPSMPLSRYLATTGFGREGANWTWPLWTAPLTWDTTKALLSDSMLQTDEPDRKSLAARSIHEVFRSRRLKIGKPPTVQYFFSPSRPV